MRSIKFKIMLQLVLVISIPTTIVLGLIFNTIYDDAVAGRGDISIADAPWRDYSKHGGLAVRHKSFTPGQLRRAQLAMYLRFYLGNPAKLARLLRSRNFREVLTLRRMLALLGRIV